MGRKLYVGNLNYRTTEDELREVFGADGREVAEVAIILDRETGRPRGFGFVTMASDEDAQKAIEALDGQMVGGRTLKVNESQDRRGPPRGRGGPRSGGRFDGPRGGGFRDRDGRGPREGGGPREGRGDRPYNGGRYGGGYRGRGRSGDDAGGGRRDEPVREVAPDDFSGRPDRGFGGSERDGDGGGGRGRRRGRDGGGGGGGGGGGDFLPPEFLTEDMMREGRDRGRRRRKNKGRERHRDDFDDEW